MREKFVLPDVDGSHVNPSHAGLQTSQQPCQYPVAREKVHFPMEVADWSTHTIQLLSEAKWKWRRFAF